MVSNDLLKTRQTRVALLLDNSSEIIQFWAHKWLKMNVVDGSQPLASSTLSNVSHLLSSHINAGGNVQSLMSCATGIHLMKPFAHNWYLFCCQCMEACYHASFLQNNIYTTVPGVNSSVKNRSCPESTRCCSQCVIPLCWCQSVFDRWVMAEWLGHWLQQWAASRVSKILVSPVCHWHQPHEAISLIIGIYLAASALRHVIMPPSYKIIPILTQFIMLLFAAS